MLWVRKIAHWKSAKLNLKNAGKCSTYIGYSAALDDACAGLPAHRQGVLPVRSLNTQIHLQVQTYIDPWTQYDRQTVSDIILDGTTNICSLFQY